MAVQPGPLHSVLATPGSATAVVGPHAVALVVEPPGGPVASRLGPLLAAGAAPEEILSALLGAAERAGFGGLPDLGVLVACGSECRVIVRGAVIAKLVTSGAGAEQVDGSAMLTWLEAVRSDVGSWTLEQTGSATGSQFHLLEGVAPAGRLEGQLDAPAPAPAPVPAVTDVRPPAPPSDLPLSDPPSYTAPPSAPVLPDAGPVQPPATLAPEPEQGSEAVPAPPPRSAGVIDAVPDFGTRTSPESVRPAPIPGSPAGRNPELDLPDITMFVPNQKAGSPAPSDLPVSLPPPPVVVSAPAPPAPAPAPPPPPDLSPPPMDSADSQGLDDGATVNLATFRAQRAAAGTDGSSTMVQAVACPEGHHSPAHADSCRQCAQPIVDRTVVRVPRPSLGRLVFNDGLEVDLDGPLVIGRNPPSGSSVGDQVAKVVRLDDPDMLLSRLHVVVQLEGWQVQVIDRESMNHTYVTVPNLPTEQLRPGVPKVIPPGAKVMLGETTSFTYEVPVR